MERFSYPFLMQSVGCWLWDSDDANHKGTKASKDYPLHAGLGSECSRMVPRSKKAGGESRRYVLKTHESGSQLGV